MLKLKDVQNKLMGLKCDPGLQSKAQGLHSQNYRAGQRQETVGYLRKEAINCGLLLYFLKTEFPTTLIGFVLVGREFPHEVLGIQLSVFSFPRSCCIHQAGLRVPPTLWIRVASRIPVLVLFHAGCCFVLSVCR